MPTARRYTTHSLSGACCAYFLIIGFLGIMMGIFFLMDGYKGTKAFGAKGSVKDFVSIGQRCRIEAIEYDAVTSSEGSSYSCDEYWTYDFVVLESEGVIDAEIDARDIGLRTVSEHRPSCAWKACGDCSANIGRYALNDGEPVEDGLFATECWLLKDGIEASSFWSCSTGGYNDTACYLLNDPNEILKAHSNQPKVIAGWALIAGIIFLSVPFLYFCGNERAHVTRNGAGDATSQQEDGDY